MTAGTLPAQDSLFDGRGRRIPFPGMRVFNKVPAGYYRLRQPEFRFDAVLERTRTHAGLAEPVSERAFEAACLDLKRTASADPSTRGLFDGVHVPFVCPPASGAADLGSEFETRFLPAVGRSFLAAYPRQHFNATLQAGSRLADGVRVAEGSRYGRFVEARGRGVVAGWYFPAALQEYDIASQRAQTASLPLPERLVLSGGFDAAAALIGSPELLVNAEAYPPVLCLSAFAHKDERLALCFKAYGLSLEFWCLSQMLTPTTTQVSEQWAGGLTLFSVLN